ISRQQRCDRCLAIKAAPVIASVWPTNRPHPRIPQRGHPFSIRMFICCKGGPTSQIFHANLVKLELTCLIKANTAEQDRKTRVVAHGIREGLYFDPLQNTGLLLVRSFEPGKRLVVVAEAHISLNEGTGRNVALLPPA